METDLETYICQKCGSTLPKLNKILHDLRCTSPKKNKINDTLEFGQNNTNNNSKNSFLGEQKINFCCEICGLIFNLKEKADHLLCHQLESDPFKNNIINVNSNDHYTEENNCAIELDSDSDGSANIINHRINNRNRVVNLNVGNSSGLSGSDINDDNDDDEIFMDDDIIGNGINEENIKSYPISKIKDINKLDEEKRKCLICLEYFKNNDDSIGLPCIHIFHSECIKKWMRQRNSCPICKSKIIEKEEYY